MRIDGGITLYLRLMNKGKVILKSEQFQLTILRLCHQIIENFPNNQGVCIIGIQEKGVLLANRIASQLSTIEKKFRYDLGKMDITFYRDDFGRREFPLKANSTEIDFTIEDRPVILMDDVLYSGRTIQAALIALQDFGRPSKVQLLTMVDRRFNRHLPIQANYAGLAVDAIDEAYVKVQWKEDEEVDQILLYSPKTNPKG